MPAIKKNEDEQAYLLVRGTIEKYMTMNNANPKKIAERIGISPSSFYAKKKNPQDFRLFELREIYKCLKVPQEERAGLI